MPSPMTVQVTFTITVPVVIGGASYDAQITPGPANSGQVNMTFPAAALTALQAAGGTYSVAVADINAAILAAAEVASAPTARS
jgi:hypothetical protein